MTGRKRITAKFAVMLLAFALVLCAASSAVTGRVYAAEKDTVTMGGGTVQSVNVPYSSDWNNSRTQIIYKAEDIGRDGTIVSIAYNVAVPDPDFRVKNLQIWMGYTDAELFDYDKMGSVATSSQTFGEDDLIRVYSGSPSLGAAAGWEKIELSEPFDYVRAQGNLVVVAGLRTAGGSNTLKYLCSMTGSSETDSGVVQALYSGDQKDSSIADLSYSGTDSWKYRSLRPDIQIEFDGSGSGTVTNCEVVFDADGGAPAPDKQSVPKGGRVTKPEDPSKEGYRFTGWLRDGSQYNFDRRVNIPFTLTAGWVRVYEIRFVNHDGTVLQSIQTDEGIRPEYTGDTPTMASEDGKIYMFAGWDPPLREADGPETYKAVFVDESELADKTALNDELSTSRDALTGVKISEDGTDVGKRFRYVSAAQRQAIDDARDAAQKVADDPLAKQDEADKAAADLKEAHEAFLAAQKYGTKELPKIKKIVISRNSGRQQPACGGVFEWVVTFEEGTDLTTYPENYFDDDFQIQRKPTGKDWKNSRCPTHSFTVDVSDQDIKNVGIVEGLAIPDNDKPTDTVNQWRFIYAGDFADESVSWPVISQDGYSKTDKEALGEALDRAAEAQNGIMVSNSGLDVSPQDFYVTYAEKKELDDAIDAARAVYDEQKTTQAKIDEACEVLTAAVEKYLGAKKAGRETEEKRYAPGDYHLIYETERLTLPDIPVRLKDKDGDSYSWFDDRELSFEFYDSTTQSQDGVYTTKEGSFTDGDGVKHSSQILSGVKMLRGHSYIVSVCDKEYMIPNYYTVTIDDDGNGGSGTYTSNMINYYIELNGNGSLPSDIKNRTKLQYFDVTKRGTPLSDVTDAKRVNVSLPVYYTQDGTSSTILTRIEGATIKLTSPLETLYVTSSSYGMISAALIEDINYMVEVVSGENAVAVPSFPLTVKDHAENGWPKSIYNHFSCGSVQGIYLVDKQYEHSRDTTLVSPSKKTSVTGLNFLNTRDTDTDHYFINDRQLGKNSAKGLEGKDYEVFMVEAVNMYRVEISKLAAGSFDISRKLPSGKKVEAVCYINKAGRLKKLNFKESGGSVTFTMKSLSMYPNVIIYKTEADSGKAADTKPEKQAVSKKTTVTINKKTVSAAAVKSAVAKAGGKSVTKIVLGKKVTKINRKAFAGTNIKTVTVKSRKLSKKSVRASLSGSKVKTVIVKTGNAGINKKYVNKYKRIFTKNNAGRKVKVRK